MRVPELNRIVRESGRRWEFSIRSYPEPGGGLPHQVHILEPAVAEPGKWVVYYTERGEVYPEGIFDDEESACEFVYTTLLNMDPEQK